MKTKMFEITCFAEDGTPVMYFNHEMYLYKWAASIIRKAKGISEIKMRFYYVKD